MPSALNSLRWTGSPGHYEVYYLTLTDPASGCGAWIRYTMLAPLPDTAEPPTCSLWFAAMDPSGGGVFARRASYGVGELSASPDPFELSLAAARLTDGSMSGSIGDCGWELRWEPSLVGYQHVHRTLQAARVAKTVLVLPHANVGVSGRLWWPGRELTLKDVRGAQAHLWGSKHATRWCWAHCNDFYGPEGEPRPDTFLDGVSVVVARWGRELGPSTPVVGRLLGEDFCSTSPARVLSNPSRLALTGWHFEARVRRRRIVVDVDAARSQLVGVTYQDPDGERAYCYNSEVASMRVRVWDRGGQTNGGWMLRDTLVCDGRAHFEYAQRDPVDRMTLHV